MSHDLGARHLLARLALAAVLSGVVGSAGAEEAAMAGNFEELVKLFADWRAFERPPMRDGAPDYTVATFARRHETLQSYRDRLAAIDSSAWPLEKQVDYQLVRAEMNGLDFYIDVLKPWERDPAFYSSIYTEQSDTPAHEGPENHASIDLWTYAFPLDASAQARLTRELRTIPPLLTQARLNLTGNARELWVVGIGTMRKQATDLEALEQKTASSGSELKRSLREAHKATLEFVAWLEQQAPSKTGPSGIGKEAYTWSLRNVHLVPMTWDDEVALLKRELSRAHAALRLEEQRNRGLPELKPVTSPEEYQQRANAAISKYIAFLKERDIIAIEDYSDSAMRERIGEYAPEATRNFFGIASHLEPMTLFTHFYHWWDLAQMRDEPHSSPIRRGPLLFNIWDTRAEGMATAMEEMVLHAGYYDDNPRAREIVWIMLAQRAARGLGSLYAHANIFTMKEAKDFQVEWTPRGWMRPDLDLLGFEQQLYLRQPGYGTCYVTGKFLLDELMKDYSHQLRDGFTVRRFFDDLNATGLIPVSLIRWQLTGRDDEIRALTAQLGKEYVHPR
jgi:hypothetical protein